MNDLEARLKASLARPEPPAGFAARVLAAAARMPPPGTSGRFRPLLRPWLAAAAALLLAAGGTWAVQARAERRQAQEARTQLLLALQITSHHLNDAFERANATRENP